MSASFAKLDSGITDSTLWMQPHDVLRVWIAMLAKADARGYVRASVPSMAHLCMIPIDRMEEILATLKAQDRYSRSSVDDGRRLREVEGGWELINYVSYRENLAHPVATLQTEGYVYYAGFKDEGEIKIGFSKNPWSRISDLRVSRPGIDILAVEKGTLQAEKDRHAQFESCRTKGEWFARGPALMAHINQLLLAYGKPTVATVATVAATKEAEAEAEADTASGDESPSATHRSARRRVAADQPESPTVVTLPLNDGSEFPITEAQVREFSDLYPAVDVVQALRSMRGWCMGNPRNRKTRAGVLRFVTRWLDSDQNKAGRAGGGNHATHRDNSAAGRAARLADLGDERDARDGIER